MKLKKTILLAIFFICSINVINGQKKSENDLTKQSIKGKVKQLKTITFNAIEKFGVLTKSGKNGTEITEFNENGFIIKVTYFDEKNKLTSTKKLKYDLKNNLIEKPSFEGFVIYKYDSNNRCIQEDECKSDRTLKFRTLKKYSQDSLGLLLEDITYNSKGAFYSKSKYKYDDNGNQIDISWYKKNGELRYNVRKEYDENGNLTEKEDVIDILGEPGNTMKYKYNENMQISETTYVESDGTIRYILTTEYDDYGNILSENSTSDSFMNTYNYNYEYKYDEFGNWIERKETGNGPTERLTIIEREITYF